MTTCPECMTHDLESSIGSPHTDTDGQGYAWTVVYEYTCKKCGCQFTETEETKRTVEVDVHGREYEE